MVTGDREKAPPLRCLTADIRPAREQQEREGIARSGDFPFHFLLLIGLATPIPVIATGAGSKNTMAVKMKNR